MNSLKTFKQENVVDIFQDKNVYFYIKFVAELLFIFINKLLEIYNCLNTRVQ